MLRRTFANGLLIDVLVLGGCRFRRECLECELSPRFGKSGGSRGRIENEIECCRELGSHARCHENPGLIVLHDISQPT